MAASGCQTIDHPPDYSRSLALPLPTEMEPPHEQKMVSLPSYRIEPPDTLEILVRKLVPRPPYRIQVYDVLAIRATGTLPEQPIDNYYIVQDSGVVDLGPIYGQARVDNMTIEEAQQAITVQLQRLLRTPKVMVQLVRTSSTQEINGNYIVRTDGTINFRKYGAVAVAGKTLAEATVAIEQQLAHFFDSPEVTVNVTGFNSKVYYVIRENSIQGDHMFPIPISGNDTVLDAIAKIRGLGQASSMRMWIARPVPGARGCKQILPVDYLAISRGGQSETNYQLMPGDRLYIAEDGLVAMSQLMYEFINPTYQLLGTSQLGTYTIRSFQMTGRAYNQNSRL